MTQENTPRQRLPKQVREEQILKAALDCFCARGYHGAGISEIVAAAGISRGNLYWHFKNKEDIFLAVLDRFIAEALADIDENLLLPDQTLDEMLKRIIDKLTARIDQDRPFMVAWLEFVAVGTRDETVRSRLADIPEKFIKSLQLYFEKVLQKGEIRPLDPKTLAMLFLSVFDGMMMRGVLWEETFSRREVVSRILTMLVDLIRSPLKEPGRGDIHGKGRN